MRHDTQELVADPPREMPGPALPPPLLEQRATAIVLFGSRVGRVHQDVGIDDEHYAPSMAL